MARDAAADESLRIEREARAWDVARLAARRLRDEYGAVRVLVYGSLARGQFQTYSDIDIAVWGVDPDAWLKMVGLGFEVGREIETNIALAESMRAEVRAAALRDGVDL